MDESQIVDVWMVFKDSIDKKQIEIIAERYVECRLRRNLKINGGKGKKQVTQLSSGGKLVWIEGTGSVPYPLSWSVSCIFVPAAEREGYFEIPFLSEELRSVHSVEQKTRSRGSLFL